MFTLIVTEKGGSPKRMDFDKDEITIGRVPGNDVILPKGNVSKRHSRVVRQDGRFFVVDLKSTNGTYLNGRRITTPSVIRPGDKIYVGDFVVMVDMGDLPASAGAEAEGDAPEELEPEASGGFAADDDQESPAPMDGSSVEPLPLDEEPPESAPPPAMPGPRGPMPSLGGPPGGPPGPMGAGPRPPMLTQPLGSAPSAGGPPGPMSNPNRPTQPPPRGTNSSPASRTMQAGSSPMPPMGPPPAGGPPRGPLTGPAPGGARPPGALSGSVPAMGGPPPGMAGAPPGFGAPPGAGPPPSFGGPPGGPPPGGFGGPPLGAPPSGFGGPGPGPGAPPGFGAPPGSLGGPPAMMPGSPARPGMAPSGSLASAGAPPMGPPMDAPRRGPAPRPRLDGEDQDDAPITGAPPPMPGGSPNVPPSSAAQIPTMSIPASSVDAAIQGARSSHSGDNGPGREYATLLGELVNEARSNGAPSASDRIADAAARARARSVIESLARRREALPSGVTTERLVRDATAEIAGTGAIETALEEPDVTTVIVEASGRVLVGRGDVPGPSALWFSGDAAVISAVDRMLHAAGISRREESVVDVTLGDGSRVTAALPPAAPSGPTVVIERPATRPTSLADLVGRGMLSQPAAALIGQALAAKRNIVVAGPRGSGRTTVLAALAAIAAGSERCVVVESRAEISRGLRDASAIDAQGNWARAIDLALRLRPQRLVVGDASEAAAAAVLSQLVTGAEGCLFVADGASPTGALERLADQAAKAGAMTRDEAAGRIAATQPFVIHLARVADGTCRVASLGEARATEGAAFYVEPAFVLRISGIAPSGRIEATLDATGSAPSFVAG